MDRQHLHVLLPAVVFLAVSMTTVPAIAAGNAPKPWAGDTVEAPRARHDFSTALGTVITLPLPDGT